MHFRTNGRAGIFALVTAIGLGACAAEDALLEDQAALETDPSAPEEEQDNEALLSEGAADPNDGDIGVTAGPVDALDPPAPDGVPEFALCFAACIGGQIDTQCVDSCVACATASGPSQPLNCGLCAICVGTTLGDALECAELCEDLL